jgi:hypothetical protein
VNGVADVVSRHERGVELVNMSRVTRLRLTHGYMEVTGNLLKVGECVSWGMRAREGESESDMNEHTIHVSIYRLHHRESSYPLNPHHKLTLDKQEHKSYADDKSIYKNLKKKRPSQHSSCPASAEMDIALTA